MQYQNPGQPQGQPYPQQPQNPYPQQGYQQPGYQQPYTPPTYPQQPGYQMMPGQTTPFPVVGGVKTPMIIAGIWHALWLIPSFFLVFTIIFAWVPIILLLLMIFEFRLVSKLNGQTPPSHHRGGAQALAIIQIICILGGDVVTGICGIIAICNVGKMQP